MCSYGGNIIMTELEAIVEEALYQTVRTIDDKKSIVLDTSNGLLYFKKILSVYNISVFSWLRENKNPKIPQIKSFRQDGDQLIVIEEFIQGKTLDEKLEEGISFSAKKRILMDICEGLTFLHGAKPPIIHRDLKASNIMLTEDGNVKIIDYDAAKIYVKDEKSDTVLIGTHGIAAPEQYGFAQSDARTDIYALGQLIRKMIPESPEAMVIAERATQMEPGKRYSSAAALQKEIGRLKEPGRKKGIRIPGISSPRRPVRILSRCGAVAMLAVVIFLGYHFWWYPEVTVRRPAYEAGCAALERGEYEEALQQFAICGTGYRNTASLIARANNDKLVAGFPKNGTAEMLGEAIPEYIEQAKAISLTDEQKTVMKTKAEELFATLIGKDRRSEAEEYASEFADAFGDEDDWKDIVEYSAITAERRKENPKETLGKVSAMRERGAYESEEHFSSCVSWYLKQAKIEQDAYKSHTSAAHAESALLIYTGMGDSIPEAVTAKNEFIEQMGKDAESLASSKEYEKAASIYDVLGEYGLKDGKEKAQQMRFSLAEEKYGAEYYAKAAEVFRTISGYRDADERCRQSLYKEGLQQEEKKDYVKAVDAYEQIPGYSDADDRKLLAMYSYCVEKKDDPTDDVYTYLDELTASGYSGTEALKADIYTWKGDLTWHPAYNMGNMQGANIELTLRGGRKDASTHVTFRMMNHTNGQSSSYTTGETYKAGEMAGCGYSGSDMGTEFFDQEVAIEAFADDGQLIASGSGKLFGTGW